MISPAKMATVKPLRLPKFTGAGTGFGPKTPPVHLPLMAHLTAPMQDATWLHSYLRNKVRSSSIGVHPGPMPGVVARPKGLPLLPPHAVAPGMIRAPGLFTPPG